MTDKQTNKIIELLDKKSLDIACSMKEHMTIHDADIFTVKMGAYIELLQLLQSSIDVEGLKK